MEFACRGLPTAAAADHSFTHPPPPHGHGDLAAAWRREELMWELHKERIRQDIILREIAETERAMAARYAPPGNWPLQALPSSQDYWHHRSPPTLPPWDDAAPRPPRPMTEHPPCVGGPAAGRPPPMYPNLELLPWPVPPPPPADYGKRTLPEGGALMPAADNAGARTKMSVSSAVEVTPGDRQAVGGDPKHGVGDGHSVQPFYRSENQSSEQREIAECTVKDQSDQLVVQRCQDGPASQENGASNEQKLAFTESPSKLNFPEGALVPDAANAGAATAMPALFAEEVTPGERQAVGGERTHGVEDGCGVQPLYGSGNQSSEQSETEESTMKDQTGELMARLYQYRPASEENGASGEQKRLGFREPTPHKRKLTITTSPVTTKKQKPLECPHNLAEHGAGKMHRSKLKKARNKPAKATPGSPPLRRNSKKSVAENAGGGGNVPRPADGEPAPSSRWACLVCNARCNSKSSLQDHLGGSRHRVNTVAILSKFRTCYDCRKNNDGDGPVKSVYYCKACEAYCTGDTMLASHLVGRKHRQKTLKGRE